MRSKHLMVVCLCASVVVSQSWADPPTPGKTPSTQTDKKAASPNFKPRPTTPEEFEALAKAGPLPPWKRYEGVPDILITPLKCTVVSVKADEIEVLPKGKDETVKYPAHPLLVSGGVCHWQSDANCYLLDDLQKGDEITLIYGTADKEKGDECFYVSIRRRPGGIIPPSRKPVEGNPYHLRRQKEVNAEQLGVHTPEALKDDADKRKHHAERGLPPPPPLKPPAKSETPPPAGDPTKKKD